MDKLEEVLTSWGAGHNALLYGPPATGKTRLISQLFDLLSHMPESSHGILLDATDSIKPFSRPKISMTIPQPIKVVWTTFHQSYGYEDFVLAMRPEMAEGGVKLQPWAGVFLDAALELADPQSRYKSVVIFIDEINRGNAARIFGEFMTFLDFDYRKGGSIPLPLPLRHLSFNNGESEPIRRPNGKAVTIPEGFTFPKDIYIVATMNSVDRAAVPIDSALARRFDRIEMRPDLKVLADHWNIDPASIPVPNDQNLEMLSLFQTAYLLLDRLNVKISSDLGPEFELGHGLMTPISTMQQQTEGTVTEDNSWQAFARVWDNVLFPQLEDRYFGRPEQLMNLLKVDSPPTSGQYAWTQRTTFGGEIATRALAPVRLSELNTDILQRSLRWLTW